METLINVGAGVLVTSVYGMMGRCPSSGLDCGSPSPRAHDQMEAPNTPPQHIPCRPMLPAPVRRITRRPSWDLSLGDYVAKCCNDIVGLEGSPGIGNHQANEQVFHLQQRVIKALEHPDEEGFVDDRDLRREAMRLRSHYKEDVAQSQRRQ